MTLSTKFATALLSFRYPSLLIKDFLNALTTSVLDFFYFDSVNFTYIDDDFDFSILGYYLLFLDGKEELSRLFINNLKHGALFQYKIESLLKI